MLHTYARGDVMATETVRETVPLMLAKLDEKRKRQTTIEQRRYEGTQRSTAHKLVDFVTGIVSFISFLLTEGNLRRAGQIIFFLIEAMLLWVVDWAIYPLRYMSGWRILSHKEVILEQSFSQAESRFRQRSLSIYADGEKPSLGRRFTIAFQNLGPTFLKLGQIISMLPALPFSFIGEFAKLCDYVPPESNETVRHLIEEGLGAPPEELFTYMDPIPLGAGSLAQVHAIVLMNGQDAVIKIQRPGLREQLERDYRLLGPLAGAMEFVCKVLRSFLKPLQDIRPTEILVDYADSTLEELDFIWEGTMMQMTRNSWDMYGLDTQIHTPSPYWEYTTENIIVMERVFFYFKGIQLDIGNPQKLYKFWDFLRSLGYDLSLAARRVYRARWQPFLCHGVRDLDTHHGNYMFCYDNIMAQVDYGITYYSGSSPWLEEMRAGLCRLWGGVAEQNASLVLDSSKNVGLVMGLDETKAMDRATEELNRLLHNLATISERPGMTGDWMMDTVTSVKGPAFLGRELTGFFSALAREAQVKLPYELVNLLRLVPYCATDMTIFAPEFDLFGESRALQGYWIGDYDGTQPYKGTNTYPEPKIPFDPDRYWYARSEEQIKADEEALCYGTLWTYPSETQEQGRAEIG